ncbi:endonuclease exonuclease phosphatase domain containing protein [Plakobranchus ocellatus]|uniref:Endonuclease exonuclease phosphatase domain containing protein n=1 Tax=Plakobranchus ocellatus TaxID=259542 RepID=A0AAV4CA33_9GAST|nr:endonuclease exonuclease phosphatase domain containing protein [Plakobranchus ocellatus]
MDRAGSMKQGSKTLIYSGRHTHERGVGILFDVTTAKSLESWFPISDRVVVAKLVTKPLNLGSIQVYAPKSESKDAEVEKFYEEIEKAKGYLKSQDIIIVMGYFNTKLRIKGKKMLGLLFLCFEEVEAAMKKMKNRKATGPDNIPVEIIKALDNLGVDLTTKLLNAIYDIGTIP